VAASPVLVPRLFDGDSALLAAFALSAPAYALYYLTRGTLAGGGRFQLYGALLTIEGLARFFLAAALAIAGVRLAGAFGMLVAVPCLIAVALVLLAARGRAPLLESGPPAAITELSASMGYLLLGSVLAQALVNAGPLVVKLLSGPQESALAGVFLNGLVIARIPLFFFQAVQAALLPALSAHAALKRHDLFRGDLRRLVIAVGGLAAASIAANWAVGPFVVERVFGGAYRVGHADMAMLAAASGSFMLALALAQALIALAHHRDTVFAWLVGVVVFALVTLPGGGPLPRVERGLVAGSVAALLTMQVVLARRLRQWSVPAETS
jgi:O-antigen/teichoic acid export membrane protein